MRGQPRASFPRQSLSGAQLGGVVSRRRLFAAAPAAAGVKGHKMALAARLLPRWLWSGSLPGAAARPRSPGRAEGRPPWAGLCCLCRRHLGWTAAPFPPAPWAAALPARDPRRPLLSPAALPALPAGPRRSLCTEEQPQQRQKTKMLILGVSNPVNWVRTRILAFLIWAYFDKEFSIKEFSQGAKQVG